MRLRPLVACLAGAAVLAATPAAVHEVTTAASSQPSAGADVFSPASPEPSAGTSPVPSPAASPDVASAAGHRRFTLLQMNLCLSGLAACIRYPEAVGEAVAVIRAQRPNAVTLNEVCERDVARIAARTGYHRRFTTVPYQGGPLPCSNPPRRGVFGNAVLTRGPVTRSVDGRFSAQDVLEQRRWLCVTTARPVTVCTTHLEARTSRATREIRRRQCAELREVLARSARRGPTIAAGDINGHRSCAPRSMWTRTDHRATNKPGIQHAYGGAAHLRAPRAGVVHAAFTDHDFLLVTARLVRRPAR
jgi:endonuclease/exonuclease/phosphatase family metal-dependent hydrolase